MGVTSAEGLLTLTAPGGTDLAEGALNWMVSALALRWQPSIASLPSRDRVDGFWDAVKTLALQHRVNGPLYKLALSCPTLLPAELTRWLSQAHTLAVLRFGHWRDEVYRLLNALNEARVPVIVLKGWALVSTLYEGDPAQRLSMDLDLLVPMANVGRAQSVLNDIDYTTLSHDPWPGFSRRYGNALTYRRRFAGKLPFLIGLHWELLEVPYYDCIPMDDWFARAQPACVAGAGGLVPAVEDHLVYLCGHLALHHQYDPALFRLYDLAALIHHEGSGLDWDAVVRRATEWQLAIPLQHTLARLEAFWPGTVPLDVARRIAELRPTRAERWIHRWVAGRRRDPASYTLLSLATLPGLGRRLRFLLEVAFPSPAYMQQRYGQRHPGLWPLTYIRRAALALRHLLRRIRWLTRRKAPG